MAHDVCVSSGVAKGGLVSAGAGYGSGPLRVSGVGAGLISGVGWCQGFRFGCGAAHGRSNATENFVSATN